jgi:hypothetical protein
VLHLVITFTVEALLQWVLKRSRILTQTPYHLLSFPTIGMFSWSVGFTVVCIAIGFPFAIRSSVTNGNGSRGVMEAQNDWANGSAIIYRKDDDHYIGEVHVAYYFDPDTGLASKYPVPDLGFSNAYNATIRDLIKRHGSPSWSLKKHVPSTASLIALLDATDLVEITSFPEAVTPDILISRDHNGTLMIEGRDNTPAIPHAIENDDTLIIGQRDEEFRLVIFPSKGVRRPAHVRIDDPIVIIRDGQRWVGVFHKGGRLIATAKRQ